MQDDQLDEDGTMTFVFTRDGDVWIFVDPASAVRWMEAVDVRDGEYTEVFLAGGDRLQLSLAGNVVELTPTGQHDLTRLGEPSTLTRSIDLR